MKRAASDGAGTAFLVIGVVFFVLGIPDDSAFVAVGVVFIALGAAGVGTRTKRPADEANGDESDGDGAKGG